MKKDIEVILNEMIDLVKAEGRTPFKIEIIQEHYNSLIKKWDLYEPAGYEKVFNGIVYHPTKREKVLSEYKGIPLVVGYITRVTWEIFPKGIRNFIDSSIDYS